MRKVRSNAVAWWLLVFASFLLLSDDPVRGDEGWWADLRSQSVASVAGNFILNVTRNASTVEIEYAQPPTNTDLFATTLTADHDDRLGRINPHSWVVGNVATAWVAWEDTDHWLIVSMDGNDLCAPYHNPLTESPCAPAIVLPPTDFGDVRLADARERGWVSELQTQIHDGEVAVTRYGLAELLDVTLGDADYWLIKIPAGDSLTIPYFRTTSGGYLIQLEER